MSTVRLTHFSDLHLTTLRLGWQPEDWLSKRVAGWLNLRVLGRAWRFRHAVRIAGQVRAEILARRPDHVVFSGDATALGFESEVRLATQTLGVGTTDMPPGLATPGNHDYYNRRAVAAGHFERYFAPWLVGIRVDDAPYPFAQQVGHLWLISLNSSTPNPLPWDASGEVGQAQLERFERLVRSLPAGPKIVVSHYPVVLADGKPEIRWRRMRDMEAVVKVGERVGVGLWLHGHRHRAYHRQAGVAHPFPIVCAGSATQVARWSYTDYSITGLKVHGQRRVYLPREGRFVDGETFDLEIAS